MSIIRAHFGISADGFGAGHSQDLEHPLGVNGENIMEWFFPTDIFQRMHGEGTGETGVDNDIAARSMNNVGAWILGRNMFGPVRGPWPDESWKGWWGDEPPYHVPTYVLTHHERQPVPMKGGTTFHFVTGGIHQALELARAAAGSKDIRIGGGVSAIRQYLSAQLIDELHLTIRPVLLGKGEELFHGLDMRALGYECTDRVEGQRATHLHIRRR
jgi:dihydrofolate reductase